MILDLHNHSIRSDDGKARVENYCQWIRRRGLPLDGFVLTEHRQFDAESDYRALADEHGLLILKGSEVETDYGHVLVFGVNEAVLAAFDFGRIDLPLPLVLREAERCGAVAVPCHPGRPNVGLFSHYGARGAVPGVAIVETLNGGSRAGENELSRAEAEKWGYRAVGGSDAHIVSHIGRCATRFEAPIRHEADLVEALRVGRYEPIAWPSTSSS
jgi:predicted metal-dependent phosphoesterase TrpH